MDAAHRTSLSAGLIIRNILLEDENVATIVNSIFPVAADADKASLPYIFYRRTSFSALQLKTAPSPNSVLIEVNCCGSTYDEALELAEYVRAALDGVMGEAEGLTMRSCFLEDSDETWEDDAFIQRLIFNVKIS